MRINVRFIFAAVFMAITFNLLTIAFSQDISLTLSSNQTYDVRGGFTVTASAQAVWSVLSDYNHMTSFVSSMESCNATLISTGNWLVNQVMIGEFLFFRQPIHLKLNVKEDYPTTIAFLDIDKKDFKTYSGTWTITEIGQSTMVNYTLNFKTNLYIPPFLEQGFVRSRIQELMQEVKREIDKRG
jgi:ribosome-associated toxin RatA of RatAB toxin-antitoxin module